MATVQEDNKAALRGFIETANTHDPERIATAIDEGFHPNVQMGTSVPLAATGARAVNDVYATLHRAFPDLEITVEDLIAEGDRVVSRQTVTGTHQGEFMGRPATGASVRYNEIFVFRFVDGRIIEVWGVVDVLSQLKQLGAIPGPPGPA